MRMNRLSTCLTVFSLVLALSMRARSESQETDLQSLLSQLPAEGSVPGGPVLTQILDLGPGGLVALCQMIQPQGLGKDVQARYALHGLANYVTRPQAEQDRLALVEALQDVLSTDLDPSVKAFLIQQLQLSGKDESVPCLAGFLQDGTLFEPAIQALVAIGTPVARDALRAALASAEPAGRNRISLLLALGTLRDKAAASLILEDARSEDATLRRTALFAMANIGDSSATALILDAARSEDPTERSLASDEALLLARRLSECGQPRKALRICRSLNACAKDRGDVHLMSAVLSTRLVLQGSKALPDLFKALDSEDITLRASVLAMLTPMSDPAVTERLIERMGPASPERRVEILGALGQRMDPAALPIILDSVRDDATPVRLAAIPVAASLGGLHSLSVLLKSFETSIDREELQALRAALMSLPRSETCSAIATTFEASATPVSRAGLLDLLARRGGIDHVPLLVRSLQDPSAEVRNSALRGLALLGSEQEIPAILALLPDESCREAAEDTTSQLCSTIEESRRSAPLLVVLPSSPDSVKISLMSILGRNGDPQALEALRQALLSEALRDAAVRALSDWPNALVLDDLLRLAETSPQDIHRILALRGVARLLEQSSSRPLQDTLRMYGQLLNLASRPDEKKLALSGLSGLKCVEALEMTLKALEDPGLCEEAGAAAATLAESVLMSASREAETAARMILEKVQGEEVRKKADDILKKLSEGAKGGATSSK